MSLTRLWLVFRLDVGQSLRRPLFWILVLILGLTSYGLSHGQVHISSGNSEVGGTKSWITSEFSVGLMLSLFFLFYLFFIAVAAGMSVIHDDELKVGELLHATSLRPSEYVWGKFLGVLTCFLIVMALHLLFMVFFNHIFPNAKALEIRGPFALTNYLRPTVVFGLPTIVFLTGISFAAGELTRKPILVFVLPVILLLACGFFLWDWSPTWLDPRIDRVLMLLDPAGFRWINRTWLKVDRGVDFYNHASIPFDTPFLLSRLAFMALGLTGVVISQRHVARAVRGSRQTTAGWLARLFRRQPKLAQTTKMVNDLDTTLPSSLAALGMRSSVPGLLRGIMHVARVELRELRNHPGLYLFIPIILLQTLGENSVALGAFNTPLLLTSGTLAVGAMNTLTVLVCLLLLFYTVESLQRERHTFLASIHYATPVSTASILFGKALANSLVGVAMLLAALLGCAIVLLIQGRVGFTLRPFVLTWGLLLSVTFLAWTSFVTAVFAVTRNRYTTYAVCLGAMIFTGYRQYTNKMNWVGNWDLWSVLRWSDMGVFELDRMALLLNRVMLLGLAIFLTALAVRFFPRRDFDAVRIVERLRPLRLLKTGLHLSPYAVVPLVAGIFLYAQVDQGFQGEAAKKRQKDYWRHNLATWKDVPLPAITAVDIDLELEPAHRWFRVSGSYDLLNHRDAELRQVPLTGGDHWENLHWTMNGQDYEPENRSHLYVFTPDKPLAPKDKLRIGFTCEGRYPAGITKNGGGNEEFILPSAVVLTSFRPSFAPVLGYLEGIGIDDDNRYESRVYPDNFYEGITDSAFGSATPFTTRLRVTAPAEYRINSVGTLVSDTVAAGRRTAVWQSDQPMRFFNVVAGRWAERHGKDTVIYYHPEHGYNIDEMSEALDAARHYYSEWFFPYPWRELKLSEFTNLASYAQGFATDITFSEGIGFLTKSDPRTNVAFLVTAHEAAHQWWGNLVTPGKGPGGDILSEGMAHFSTILLFEQVKGPGSRIEFCKRIEESYNESRRKDSERPLVKIDGSRPGDTTVTYDKGGWVFWMLLQHIGRERALVGIREFIRQYRLNPDHPVLQDFVATMRKFAPDAAAYDAFVGQWFFQVVVPEYRLSTARRVQITDTDATYPASGSPANGETWEVTVRVENAGTGRMPVEVAAIQGERFNENGKASPDYHEARASVVLGAGDVKDVNIRCNFKPDRVLMDPDALVLQLLRKMAIVRF
jgi:ABC-type transport system involved in multi-copper enzyme maturation permease subunit